MAPSADEYELMQKSNWLYTKGALLYAKTDYHPRVLQKKTKRPLENFRKHPYYFAPVRPVKKWETDMTELYERFPTVEILVDRWLEKRIKGFNDGWYALVGWQYKSRYSYSRKRGVRDLRWLIVWRVNDGNIVEVIKRSKGKPSGRRWKKPPPRKTSK